MEQENMQEKVQQEPAINPEGLKQMISKSSDDALMIYLERMDSYDRYIVIRDYVSHDRIMAIKRNADPEVYKKFQVLKEEAKKEWDRSHTMANMRDVDMALTRLYNIVVQNMNSVNNSILTILSGLQDAVNKVEKNLGLEETKIIKRIEESEEPIDADAGEEVANESTNEQGEPEDN